LAFFVTGIEVVAAVDVDLDSALDARHDGHSDEPTQRGIVLDGHDRHARASSRSARAAVFGLGQKFRLAPGARRRPWPDSVVVSTAIVALMSLNCYKFYRCHIGKNGLVFLVLRLVRAQHQWHRCWPDIGDSDHLGTTACHWNSNSLCYSVFTV